MKTKEEMLRIYYKYKCLDYMEVDINDLPDIKHLKLEGDTEEEKILSYLRQGYNPWYVRKGKVLIILATISDGPTIQEKCLHVIYRINK